MAMAARGYAKLVEEFGEVLQIVGKRLAYFTTNRHPDGGPPLTQRLEREVADTYAALDFVVEKNGLDSGAIHKRRCQKLVQFQKWDEEPDNHHHGIDAVRDETQSSRRLQWFMQNGWDVTYHPPASFLTDEANFEHAWSCKRTVAPFRTSKGGDRTWFGSTPAAALEKSVAELGTEFPLIAQLIKDGAKG